MRSRGTPATAPAPGVSPPPQAPDEALSPSARTEAPVPEVSLTLRQTLRTCSFWLLAAVMGLRQMVTEGISVHLVVLLVDQGRGRGEASGLLGISALIGVPARHRADVLDHAARPHRVHYVNCLKDGLTS